MTPTSTSFIFVFYSDTAKLGMEDDEVKEEERYVDTYQYCVFGCELDPVCTTNCGLSPLMNCIKGCGCLYGCASDPELACEGDCFYAANTFEQCMAYERNWEDCLDYFRASHIREMGYRK